MRRLFTVLLVLLLARPAGAALEVDERAFSDGALGVRLQIPEGWSASTQTGYPGLLLILQAPGNRSRIVLGTAELPRGKTMTEFVAGNLAGLAAVGMTVRRSQQVSLQGRKVWEIVAQAGRDLDVRQLALGQGNRVFTLTLAGPRLEVARLQAELGQVLAGLSLSEPARPGP